MLTILVNPRAQGVRRDPALPARLTEIARGAGEVITTADGELPRICADLAVRGASLVALCGGDGTGQTVLTELVRAYRATGRPPPRIALLRGGTINTVAANLGVHGAPEELLGRLVARLSLGAPLPTVVQPLLAVEGRLGFLFAAALGARFLELYYDHPSPGPARAAALAVQISASALVGGASSRRLFAPISAELELDSAPPVRMDGLRLLVASTVVDVGIGMRLCPRAVEDRSRFQLIASALSPTEMALQLPAVRAGQPLRGVPHLDPLVARATVRFASEEPYTLDGDLFRARSIELAIGPCLSIVRC